MNQSTPDTTPDDLQDLACRIRQAVKAVQNGGAALLHLAMKAGDALNQAQERVSTNWKKWLHDNCFMSVRSALVYQQLANHRDEIQAEIERAGEISLRAALRLIAKSENPKKPPKAKKPSFDALNWWKSASREDRTRLLEAISLVGLIGAMPPSMRKELERRAKRGKPTPDNTDAKLTKAFHTAMSHLKSEQGEAALAALRGIARMHSDFYDLVVAVVDAEEQRRAA